MLTQLARNCFSKQGAQLLKAGILGSGSENAQEDIIISQNRYRCLQTSNIWKRNLTTETETAKKESDKDSLVSKTEAIAYLDRYRSAVISEYVHGEQIAKGLAQWKRPGFQVLNEVFKGFRPGEMTIFSGPTGFGKTTFLCEYSVDLFAQGVRTLFCSFEIPDYRVLKFMLQQYISHAEPEATYLWKRHNTESEHCQYIDQRFSQFSQAGLMRFFPDSNDFGTRPSKKVDPVEEIKEIVHKYEIQHVVLDNLQFMMGTLGLDGNSNFDRFRLQDIIIAELRTLSTSTGAHVTVVIHPRKEREGLGINSIYGGGKATQEADNVILIQKSQKKEDTWLKFLHICKNRFGGERVEEDRIQMVFDKCTYCHELVDLHALHVKERLQ